MFGFLTFAVWTIDVLSMSDNSSDRSTENALLTSWEKGIILNNLRGCREKFPKVSCIKDIFSFPHKGKLSIVHNRCSETKFPNVTKIPLLLYSNLDIWSGCYFCVLCRCLNNILLFSHNRNGIVIQDFITQISSCLDSEVISLQLKSSLRSRLYFAINFSVAASGKPSLLSILSVTSLKYHNYQKIVTINGLLFIFIFVQVIETFLINT